jgi:hypothetical protein
MNGTEDEIETIPVFLHPGAARSRSFRIVIQLETGPDFHAGIGGAQFIDFIEIDPRVVAIVVGKRDVGQAALTGTVNPRLEQGLGERLDPMPLGVGVVIGKELRVNR